VKNHVELVTKDRGNSREGLPINEKNGKFKHVLGNPIFLHLTTSALKFIRESLDISPLVQDYLSSYLDPY
jgi:hypothetical protein